MPRISENLSHDLNQQQEQYVPEQTRWFERPVRNFLIPLELLENRSKDYKSHHVIVLQHLSWFKFSYERFNFNFTRFHAHRGSKFHEFGRLGIACWILSTVYWGLLCTFRKDARLTRIFFQARCPRYLYLYQSSKLRRLMRMSLPI